MQRHIAVIGSTGSVGRQTLEVVDAHPERFKVVSLAAGSNEAMLFEQAKKYRPKMAVLGKGPPSKDEVPGVAVGSGMEALCAAAAHPDVEIAVIASSGIAGLRPLIAALRAGKRVALANKESLVVAGDIVMAALFSFPSAEIIPVDSEHNAVFQCLRWLAPQRPERIVLTASGGPFLESTLEEMELITPEDALAHPTWKMGPKVTVDSATLMNKGFEVIEAHWLFSVPADSISVIVNPSSVVHCLVEARDGTIAACMGVPDMRLPIQYALYFPERPEFGWGRLHIQDMLNLRFQAPDLKRFPCLGFAYEALDLGCDVAAAMCGADDVAVAEFLEGRLRFTQISEVIRRVMKQATLNKRFGQARAEAISDELDERTLDRLITSAETAYAWGIECATRESRALAGGDRDCTCL